MKKLVRNYNGSDGYMIETSAALLALFNENLADFTAFDSTLDATFASDWQAKIKEASQVEQNSQIKDVLAQKTEEVLKQMELCRIKYNEVKFFAGKVFENNSIKLAQFGADNYSRARIKQNYMIAFMDEMHKACVHYQTELLAGGMSQTSIDEIATLRDALFMANTDQESYVRARPVLTQKRIDILNSCYAATRTVIEAAMVVYYNDYARRNMFVYSPSTSDNNNSDIVQQAITNDDPVLLLSIDYNETRQYILRNNGPADVKFYISDSMTNVTKSLAVLAQNFISVQAIDLGDDGSNLYAVIVNSTGSNADVEVEVSLEV